MALYRKYRPASFQEVVGQEQVTRPLSVALDSGRINHAYLFSGPRGCGKTSSARILARSLNCVQGPTSTPCGQCHSCVALAPNGPGTVDVIELDAASNNGVEDMRELRDRAVYAPAESRYRIFIIDEAHMISNSGANALLKTVEEPPEHLIFIFATTEPEKVIGTIRSRTHHYPFRLLTPQAMQGLLERTMQAEQVPVEPAVYPLVIRAGGGSPRDTLSVLDQLLSGSGPEGLTYDLARLLLGVTDESLLDAVVNDLATQDKAHLFHVLDDVIESGTDPRRFATDLLDRFRDLLIIRTVPDAFDSGLVAAPNERQEILVEQANSLEPRALTELASTVQDGLLELRGATSPRLLLEILSAKLLLIMDKQQESPLPFRARRGAAAKEPAPKAPAPKAVAPQQAAAPQVAPQVAAAPAQQTTPAQQIAAAPAQPAAQPATIPEPAQTPAAASAAAVPAGQEQPQAAAPATPAPAPQPQDAGQAVLQAQAAPQQESPAPQVGVSQAQPQQAAAPQQPVQQQDAAAPQQPAVGADPSAVQAKWNQVLKSYGRVDKAGWVMLMQARLLAVQDNTIYLGHPTGALKARLEDPSHIEPLEAVIAEVMGQQYSVRFVVGTDPKVLGAELAHYVLAATPVATDEGLEAPQPAAVEQSASPADTAAPSETPTETELAQQPQSAAPSQTPVEPANPTPPAAAAQTLSVEQPAEQPVEQPATPPTEAAAPLSAEQPAQPAPEQPAPVAQDGWGAPAPIGGQATEQEQPAPAAPPAAEAPEATPRSMPSVQSAAPSVAPAAPAPASPAPDASQNSAPAPKKSALQEKVERSRLLAARRREEQAKQQFSDGTPLPPEPEPEPPAPADYYPGSSGPRGGFGAPANGPAGNAQSNSASGSSYQAAPAAQSPGAASASTPGAPTGGQPQPPGASTMEDQEAEVLHEASYGSGQRDHRNPLDVAVDLVTSELGGRRV